MANGLLQMIANPQVADVPGAFARGRQFKLQDIAAQGAIQQQQQEQQRQKQLSGLRAGVGATIEQGGTAFQNSLKRLSVQDPDTAAKIQRITSGVDEQNLKRGAFDFLAAASSDGESRSKMLEIAKQKVSGSPFLSGAISKIQSLQGPEQEAEILSTVKFLKNVGLLEREPAAAKTSEQIERELGIKEQVAATGAKAQVTRKAELKERKEEARRKAGELKPTMQKILDTAQTQSFDAEKTAGELTLLADDFDRKGIPGGTATSIGEFFKDVFGTQDEISALRRKFRGIRSSQATKNLPPGPASDKDIQLALSGFPPENAPASQVSSFLRGASKIARIDQTFQRFKADYISVNGNTAGMLKAWDQNKKEIISQVVADPTAQDTKKIVMRHPTLGDISEQDITDTMKENNMTREQVLQSLGG